MPKNFGKLAIRLALHGCVNRPFYHVVVIKKHMGRDKPPIEQLGTYDPMPNIHNEKLVSLNFDRLQHYIMKKADITKPVEKLLGLSGFLPIHPMTYIDAKRNKKKAAAEAAAAEAAAAEAAAAQSATTDSESQQQESSS